MARKHELLFALNSGGVDAEALARVDLEKMRLAGEHPVSNWFPRVLGPMGLRPGLGYRSRIGNDAVTRLAPFVINSSSGFQLGFSEGLVTIYKDGVPVQVVSCGSAITNPTFSGASGWANVSETGDGSDGTVSFTAPLVLRATKWRSAGVEQAVSIAAADQSKPHTLSIDVSRGPVFFRVGRSTGAEDVFSETRLLTGIHKLTFTPGAATVYIRFRAEDTVERHIASCRFEHTVLGGAGNLTIPTPWGAADLPYLAWDQSADVLFVGDGRHQPRRIERRGDASWSVTIYQTRTGPFDTPLTDKITLTPSVKVGNGTLTASLPYFKAGHAGTLFELTHGEQNFAEELNGADQTTDYITVTGVYSKDHPTAERSWSYDLDLSSGSFVGTIILQRSTDADALIWSEVKSFTADATETFNDEESNLVAHYRFKVKSYTSGSALITVAYAGGTKTGLVRVTRVVSDLVADCEVVAPLGAVTATRDWRSQSWSDTLGWPRVPRFFDGRLWWFRSDRAYGSIVDDFDNYDDGHEGDSGPVIRSIGAGAVEGAQWALDMQRLIVGTTGYEASIRSSSFDEPITPAAFAARNASTLGSSLVPAAKVDRGLFFVHRSGRRLYEMLYSVDTNDYTSQDATRLNPSALDAVVKAMAVQRSPDTRVYLVLEDGSCVVLTWERDERVYAFTTIDTDGSIEDVAVCPGTEQDEVYFVVARVVRGATQRFIERMGNERAQRSVSTCTLLDAYVEETGSVSAITGATHLAGRTVQVWADGSRRADVTLDGSGNASFGSTVYSRVVYGIGYTASFKSVKLAYAAQLGTAIGQHKRVANAGVILSNSCLDGIRVGKDASNTDPLPKIVNGAARTPNQFFSHFDIDLHPIASDWDPDSRLYIEANSAEGPVTVQAVVFDIETSEAISPKGD